MTNVTLQIGGRAYTVACDDGEEDHIRMLGATIADKVQSMGSAGQSEPRQLLFAALVLADELHEARAALADALAAASPDRDAPALEALASRLENIASHLER
ncbi:cell division protein ZapA [Novosphingobium sp.]|uniref:cell division protein ZapA n=1 Tax=Novosphingobium sp. TaxID=1874826 RepID=UPI0027375D1A|nr:cell division protein ZapA [Novosphingobium sp.]MDP3907181.1 cell division protein ZapA [Novosphingobium sp.]